ncbi:MAG: LacI family DNA-binding transcriptional regulator [Actinomycetota bacterium]
MPVTLREVARRAGVHPGTASRALNPQTRALVNEGTARKVMRAADELGYRPNPLARGLKTNRSFTVGVLIPDLTNPLFPPIVRGIEDALAVEGYTALLANSDNDPEKERLHFESMKGRQVEGFIMATAQRDHPLVEEAVAAEAATVLVNRTIDGDNVFAVIADDRVGVRQAIDHLVGLGHRRIAHLGGPQKFSTGFIRFRSFLEAMTNRGLEPDHDLIKFCDAFVESEGARAFKQLLDEGKDFSAVFAANDLLALGCYDVLASEPLSCPADVSIVGFNDIPFLDKLRPPLTTVRIPHYDIGLRAAELTLERLRDPAARPVTVMLPTELVVRGSTSSA